MRRDLAALVQLLAAKPRIRDLALTTNGVLLEAQAEELHAAGLQRVTVSLDSLDADRFRTLTQRDDLAKVLRGIEHAAQVGFASLKIDTVVVRGTNEDGLVPLLEYGKKLGAEVRFIEYMDVGGATRWHLDQVVSRAQILSDLENRLGVITPVEERTSAPADRYQLPDGTTFGIISSTTKPFCASCDRSRLTADGHWFRCLYAREGTDLRTPLRSGACVSDLAELIRLHWRSRADRGAEERLAQEDREALAQPVELHKDPHLEMHTRGG